MDFATELEECRGKLESLMMRRGQSPDDAKDLAQDTLVRAWRSKGSYKAECPLLNWLCKICVRLLLDRKRNDGRRIRIVASIDEVNPETELDWSERLTDPNDDFRAVDSQAAVEQFLTSANISPQARIILLSDESDEQLAAKFGIDRGTVRSRRHRLIYGLRQNAKRLVA